MSIVDFLAKDWRRMAVTGLACFVGFAFIGAHTGGDANSVSVSKGTGAERAINERFNQMATEPDAKARSAPTKVTNIRKVGGATFFLAVEQAADNPMEYETIAKKICRELSPFGVDACIVAIWDDERKMGTTLPMTVEQESAQIYAWSLGRSLWSCREFPEMGTDKCY